ncbi:glycosyltransferase [Arthrobacter sp. Sa2BUA2]|uniref:Glycosyltransferase n=1 Tax=Arthrobacter pullicola TaxID=2762224 RepID=A0ABR8YED9_9MICC|nr:glycosyltransferase [Arthrobacter pullicola]MBD8042492.1 glycosyltransferase [Arthrobacter pullicola]
MQPRNTIRVASVPSGHVYIRHLDPVPGATAGQAEKLPKVVRLPDPDPDSPDNPATGKWWPPVMLHADWIDANAASFDVFHIHFGFDALDPQDLQDAVTALRRHGKPLIYTVHDLRNPHHNSPEAHNAHLDVLIPGADALITLTAGAAAEIERRWGRTPHVIPHPHVVELDTMEQYVRRAAQTPPGQEFRVGVHVKSLRASMEPLPVIQALLDVARQDGGMVVQVNGHKDVLESGGARYDAGLAHFLTAQAAAGELVLHVHDFLPDDDLWEYLAGLDLSVLPYRFGTHSGWLEACRDLGTAVAAPDCGYYAGQGPVFGYHHDEAGLDPESLKAAVRAARLAGPPEPLPTLARAEQRTVIAAQHAEIYATLLDRSGVLQ